MKKRILAMIIDYIIILAVCGVPYYIYLIINYNNFDNGMDYYIVAVIILTMFKDSLFKNASIGKKIVKIEIRKKNNTVPSIYTIILRNLTLIIWPLECLLILLKKNRIGDMIFDTKVVEIKKEN